ncbi:hypothetical protein TrRE_jg7188, partial [Triparma retinervis]
MQLCSPEVPKDLTQLVAKVSEEALSFTLVSPKPSLTEVTTAVVIAMANCFEDGLLYVEGLSRFNHSCNPNAIYLPISQNGKHVKALRDISPGEEITVSYLGLKVYAGREERHRILMESKFFQC